MALREKNAFDVKSNHLSCLSKKTTVVSIYVWFYHLKLCCNLLH